jgi:hypothetical protein
LNAPFLMAIITSPKAGTILYRPDLTTSIEGWPIKPIMGRGGWQIRNDYDKECNEDLNMPYSQRRYEIGFRLDDPDASTAVIFRNTVHRLQPANECDWAPVTTRDPIEHDDFSVSCETNLRRAPQHVTAKALDKAVYIECDAFACGVADGTIHRLKFTRRPDKPGYLPFANCGCGDTISLVVVDSDGNQRVVEDAVITDTSAAYGNWPDSVLWVQLEEALGEGECIKYAYCQEDSDEEPELPFDLNGRLLISSCTPGEDGALMLLLDDLVTEDYAAEVDVNIVVYDAEGSVVETVGPFEITEVAGSNDALTIVHEDGASYTDGCPEGAYLVLALAD